MMVDHYQELLCSMDHECWKTITDYPNYQVSNFGRVRNVVTGKILKSLTNSKYYRVALYGESGKSVCASIHRLVGESFLANPYPDVLLYINHIDENKHNNYADNLEWCTAKYNYNWSKDKAILGSIRSAEDRGKTKSIVVYNIWTEQAFLFNSIRGTERELGIDNTNMQAPLNHKGHRILVDRKYMVFYLDDWNCSSLKRNFDIFNSESRIARSIIATDLDTQEKYNFSSMREAEKVLGFPHQAMSRCLNGNQKSTHGYSFSWGKQPKIPNELPELIKYEK